MDALLSPHDQATWRTFQVTARPPPRICLGYLISRKAGCPTQARRNSAVPSATVAAYYVGTMGLTCIAVDALTGPQVTFEAIRLVGRPPSELSDELSAYLESCGRNVEITPCGDIGSQDLGIMPRAQRAGDVLLTRLVLGRPNDWANTMSDCIPACEMLGHF